MGRGGRVSLSEDRIFVNAIPCEMDFLGGDSLEVSLFTMETFVFDEEPDPLAIMKLTCCDS